MVVLEWLLQDDLMAATMLFLIVLTVNMEVFYIRSVAEVLATRMRWVRTRFGGAIRKPQYPYSYRIFDQIDRFERLWQMKIQFEEIFGAFLGVHFILDLIMVTMLLFICIYFLTYVGGDSVLIISVVAIFTRIVPVGVKITLLVRPFVRVAMEVSRNSENSELLRIKLKSKRHY